MILSFRNEGTDDIFNGANTKSARTTCPELLWKVASRKLDQLDSVTALAELRIPPAIDWNRWLLIEKVNIVFGSMISIGFASVGKLDTPMKLRSETTIEAES